MRVRIVRYFTKYFFCRAGRLYDSTSCTTARLAERRSVLRLVSADPLGSAALLMYHGSKVFSTWLEDLVQQGCLVELPALWRFPEVMFDEPSEGRDRQSIRGSPTPDSIHSIRCAVKPCAAPPPDCGPQLRRVGMHETVAHG